MIKQPSYTFLVTYIYFVQALKYSFFIFLMHESIFFVLIHSPWAGSYACKLQLIAITGFYSETDEKCDFPVLYYIRLTMLACLKITD